MARSVFANGRAIVHKGSGTVSIAFPDVCKTTPFMVPVPYPNIGKSSDTAGGPTSVTVDGKMPMVKGARYACSTGDEAGAGGGVLSQSTRGACAFLLYSFDVTFEGRGACRVGDPMFHNKKNALG
ncbi:MAG: DUF4150 domain-containing protein [Planctomycetes bacterium]|nr:DUF4150 domain-containing protein [Planctomycetota bacterium]